MTRLQAHVLLVLTAAIWGSTFIVQKTAFSDELLAAEDAVGPILFTAIRFLLGALVVLPLMLRENAGERRAGAAGVSGKQVMSFAVVGVVLLVASITQQVGIIHTSVTNAGFLTALYVPMVPLLALLLFRVWPRLVVWPAAGGCVAGSYLLSGGSFSALSVGDGWVIFSAFFWAMHITLVGIFSASSKKPFTLSFVQFSVSGIAGMVAALSLEPFALDAILAIWPEIAYAGVVSVGIAFTMQVVAQAHTHPATAGIIMSSEMLFAALFAAIFLGESLGLMALAGCALIFFSALAVELAPYIKLFPERARGR